MKSAAYKLYPHGDLESPIGGVWMVTGRSAFPLYRRMTVWKLPDGTLLAHSVIAMDDARMAALDALGRLSIILVREPPIAWMRASTRSATRTRAWWRRRRRAPRSRP